MSKPTKAVAEWKMLNTVLPHSRRTLLSGPPGTGKTYIGGAVNPGTGVYSITLTEETPAAELRGHYIPHSSGEFIWHDGPAIRAWREGARLVVNEIDKASPDVQTFLHVILDDTASARLTLPSGETVMPTTEFSCVATMNGEPHDLPDALRDRFPVRFTINSINPEAIKSLPKDLQDIAILTSEVSQAARRLSIRAWMAFADLREKVAVDTAGVAIFGERWPSLHEALKVSATPTE